MTPHQHRRQALTYQARALRLDAAAMRARARHHDHIACLCDLLGGAHVSAIERDTAWDYREQSARALIAAAAVDHNRDHQPR